MSKTAVLIFCTIFGTESLIICTGNAFTIFVFWNQRSSSLRRACYLLINLAVVDLLVGVAELVTLATEYIPLLFGDTSSFDDFVKKAHRVSTLLLMFSTMSRISLAVISLERALAIFVFYRMIRSRLKRSPLIFDYNQRRNMERNMKLSKTLFIVIALSFACWLPAVILYTVMDFCFECVPKDGWEPFCIWETLLLIPLHIAVGCQFL